jgi:hypothetical protein
VRGPGSGRASGPGSKCSGIVSGCVPNDARGWTVASSFYRPRGGGLQTCHKVVCIGDIVPACSACCLMDVLANRPCGCRVGFCTCMRAASRVIWPAFAHGCCPHIDLRVSLTGVLGLYRDWCGDVMWEQGSTPSGVAPQCRGWPHRGGGDGKDML